jgi:nucleoid-associated protein YgaU
LTPSPGSVRLVQSRHISLYQPWSDKGRRRLAHAGAEHEGGLRTGRPITGRDPVSLDDVGDGGRGYRGLFLYPQSPTPSHSRPNPAKDLQQRRSRPREELSGRGAECGDRFHIVRLGESLWAIAARRLETHDPLSITRLWRSIYRINQRVIGTDPALIRPGQRLQMPPGCKK